MLNTTLLWRSRPSMAAATVGSSKIFPPFSMVLPTPRRPMKSIVGGVFEKRQADGGHHDELDDCRYFRK